MSPPRRLTKLIFFLRFGMLIEDNLIQLNRTCFLFWFSNLSTQLLRILVRYYRSLILDLSRDLLKSCFIFCICCRLIFWKVLFLFLQNNWMAVDTYFALWPGSWKMYAPKSNYCPLYSICFKSETIIVVFLITCASTKTWHAVNCSCQDSNLSKFFDQTSYIVKAKVM